VNLSTKFDNKKIGREMGALSWTQA